MTRPTILVTESDRFSQTALRLLQEVGDPILANVDRPSLLRLVVNADVLWVRLRHLINEEVMDAAQRLRVIVTPTTGLNHIAVERADARKIAVLSLRGEREFLRDVRATAEHTIGLALALMRQIPAAAGHTISGGWDRDIFRGCELHNKTVGVVGYGRLGRIVARYFRAFDARVLVSDPGIASEEVPAGIAAVPLIELLHEADIVTVHVSLSEATRHMFGPEQFRRMKRGAWFINTARGELVDEEALLSALESKYLAGAGLDVLTGETAGFTSEHPLLRFAREHPNLIITPHIGGCTHESMEKTEVFLAGKLHEHLGGKTSPSNTDAQ